MKMKKWLALFFAAMMVLSIAACGEEKGAKTNKKKEDQSASVYEQALAFVEDGDYEAAYLLLKDLKNTNENRKAIELRNKLVWVPLEYTRDDYSFTCTYDEQGRLLSAVKSTATSHDWLSIRCHYTDARCTIRTTNGDGTMEIVACTYDEQGRLSSYGPYAYTYDANGNMATREYTKQNGTTEKTVYSYDKDGLRLSEHTIAPNTWSTITYTYDAHGNMVTAETTESNGLNHKTLYAYDEVGNLLSKEYFGSDQSPYAYYYYSYDENNNLIKQEKFDPRDGVTEEMVITLTYDSEGDLTAFTYGKSSVAFTYSADKRTITRISSAEERDYTYDKFGNLIASEGVSVTWKLFYYPHGIPDEISQCCAAAPQGIGEFGFKEPH